MPLRDVSHFKASPSASANCGKAMDLRTIDGLVVQSTGLRRATASISPVGATRFCNGDGRSGSGFGIDECAAIADLHVATDDGSEGFHGLVTQLLDRHLATLSETELARLQFYNCGPEPMVHAAMMVQRKYVPDRQIHSAIDYLTKCGVGICGACAAPDGRRLCVDGPFLSQG